MPDRTASDVVRELFDRIEAGDTSAIDELVADDMVNHAAGPQGRDGWKAVLAVIANDLGPTHNEIHHLYGEGEFVTLHMTMHGHHRASTMPLLTGVPVSDRDVAWTFNHICRVVDGQVVEHWACRDDVGLLAQLGAWPPG